MRKQIMIDGKVVDRYNSLEPSKTYAPEAINQRHDKLRFLPFREHIARVCRIIDGTLSHEIPISKENSENEVISWEAVARSLHMACSISDLSADTTYVDISESWAWCGHAFDAAEADSEVASKFMTGLVIFNFIWSALECVSVLASSNPRETTNLTNKLVRDLEFLKEKPEGMPFFKETFLSTWNHCRLSGDMQQDLHKVSKYLSHRLSIPSVRLLCRIRNKFAHGKFSVPFADDHGPLSKFDANKHPEICRFYSAGRLALFTIQSLLLKIVGDKEIFVPHVSDICWTQEDEKCDLRIMLLHLHTIAPILPDGQLRLPFLIFPADHEY